MFNLLISLLISIFIHVLVLAGITYNASCNDSDALNHSNQTGVSSIKARLIIREKVKKVSTLGTRKAKLPNKTSKGQSKLDDKSLKAKDSGNDSILSKYLSDIRELILKNKYKSSVASRLKLTGTTVLSFKIQFPNSLKEVKVIKSSGKRPLDESAIKTIQRIEKIPSIPSKLELEEITMTLEMVFE